MKIGLSNTYKIRRKRPPVVYHGMHYKKEKMLGERFEQIFNLIDKSKLKRRQNNG